jgi:hypothetical protein
MKSHEPTRTGLDKNSPPPDEAGVPALPDILVRVFSSDLMRKKTLFGICFVLAFSIVYLFRWFASSHGIRLPLIGYVSPLIASFIIVPLLLIPLTALNQYVLAWRKSRGRDIEEEEKHEFDEADIISLRPRQPHEHSSTYRR